MEHIMDITNPSAAGVFDLAVMALTDVSDNMGRILDLSDSLSDDATEEAVAAAGAEALSAVRQGRQAAGALYALLSMFDDGSRDESEDAAVEERGGERDEAEA
jgi:prephenate dehydratase